MAYLTTAELKTLSTMPASDFEAVVARHAAFVEETLDVLSSEIDTVLRKRYAVPFVAPNVPKIVRRWLADMATAELYLKRGADPTNTQLERHFAAADRAREQMQASADSENGRYDLPTTNAGDTSAISKGGPYGYSEASPYDWTDAQAEAIRGGR